MQDNNGAIASLIVMALLCGCVEAQLNMDSQIKILDKHNTLRREVNPAATNMEKMVFNADLARVAQAYADRCIWGHNSERSNQTSSFTYVGENLYMTTAAGEDYEAAVQSWFDERNDYDYSTVTCTAVCGHYTQVVWATSNQVGCGAKRCATLENSSFQNALLVVCNYGPGGNYRGMKPYIEGSPCNSCPTGKTNCDNKLCAANSLVDILSGKTEDVLRGSSMKK